MVAGLTAVSGCAISGLGNSDGIIPLSSGTDTTASGWRAAARNVNAMNGGLIGGSIGRGLSHRDRRKALEAEYRALEYGQDSQAISWNGDDSSGKVIAAQPYRVGSQDCRQYLQTVFTMGAPLIAHGTACRNTDGSWSLLT